MRSSVKQTIVSLVSVVAGASVALAVGQMIASRSDVSVAAKRFAELGPQQQQLIHVAAERLLERPQEDVERLGKIHELIVSDPRQGQKLQRLADWYRSLDPQTKMQLMPDGQFAANWKEEVEQRYFDHLNTEPQIRIRLDMPEDLKTNSKNRPELTFSDSQFFAFVDLLVPAEVPHELEWKLHGLTRPHEIALAKSLWFSHELLGSQDRNDFGSMIDATNFMRRRMETDLVSSEDREIIQKWKTAIFDRWGQDDRDEMRCDLILTWEVMKQGMAEMQRQIKKPDEAQRLAAMGSLPREEQLDLFSRDPASALKQLDEIALERSGNVAAADLLAEYRRVSNEFEKRLGFLYIWVGANSQPGRGGPGRRPAFSGGGRDLLPPPGNPPRGPRGPGGGMRPPDDDREIR